MCCMRTTVNLDAVLVAVWSADASLTRHRLLTITNYEERQMARQM